MEPKLSDADARLLAIAAALAEDEARRSRRPVVSADDGDGSPWQRQALAMAAKSGCTSKVVAMMRLP